MSALRFLPLPAYVLVTVLLVGVALAAWTLMRWRTGSAFTPAAIVTAVVVIMAIAGASLWSLRPGFLASPALPHREPGEADHTRLARAEAFLQSLVEAEVPPGLTAVVVKDGTVVYARGFGLADGPSGVPARADTVYRWWSITKVFTAVAIMQLVEQGRVRLDDPVSKHVPHFAPEFRGADAPVITIRDVLTHSSGLPDAGTEILGWLHFEGDPALNQTQLVEDVLPRFSRLASAPGTQGRYSNVGYMVLSAVIEAASGERYERYVTTHILEPLGMDHTGFEYPAVPEDQVAVGSHPLDLMVVPAAMAVDLDKAVRERRDGRLWFERVYPDQTAPSGLIGPARDMGRFMAAMLAGGELDGERVLSETSLTAMAQWRIAVEVSPAPGDDFGFGYAWFIKDPAGRVALSHGGQGMGMTSMMSLYPDEGLGILVVGNSTYLGRDFGASAVAALADVEWSVATAARD